MQFRLFQTLNKSSNLIWNNNKYFYNSKDLNKSFHLIPNFITEQEENILIKHLDPLLSKRRYQGTHWDDVIQSYKEIILDNDLLNDHKIFSLINQRMIDFIITNKLSNNNKFQFPHVVDLSSEGHIGAHVDSIKFSGSIVAGLSLNSSRILRLEHDNNYGNDDDNDSYSIFAGEVILEPRSLYILSGPLRYNFSHQILGKKSPKNLPTLINSNNCNYDSNFDRRISVVIRDEVSNQ